MCRTIHVGRHARSSGRAVAVAVLLGSGWGTATARGLGPADAIYVDDDAPPGGNGASWGSSFRFLRDALDAAEGLAGVEIRVAQGVYLPDRSEASPLGTGDRDDAFDLVASTSLRGGFAGLGAEDPDAHDPMVFITLLSGDLAGDDERGGITENAYHVVQASNVGRDTRLDGFVVSGGNASGTTEHWERGGGLYLRDGADANVRNCVFAGNHAAFGGGAMAVDSSPTIESCAFRDNHAETRGGGLYLFQAPAGIVRDCVFESNSAGDSGAGLKLRAATLVLVERCVFEANAANHGAGLDQDSYGGSIIRACVFRHNVAAADGGGAKLDTASVLEACLFDSNVAADEGGTGRGGGVDARTGINLINCVLVGNTADQGGAARFPAMSGNVIVNCTIVANTATTMAGGVFVDGILSVPVVVNSILWDNAPGQIDGVPCSVFHSVVQGGWTGFGFGVITDPPRFVDFPSDLALAAGSPAIDAAINAFIPEGIVTDIAGRPRFTDDPFVADTGIGEAPFADLGAYEREPGACPGDVDGDGMVATGDLLAVLAAWGTCEGCAADVTGDGVVDVEDLLAVLQAWGVCRTPSP